MEQWEADEITNYLRSRKDELLAGAASGDPLCKSIVSVHRMLVKSPDWPTWGILMGLVDDLKKRPPASAEKGVERP